jgi:hypothetical protein
MWYKKPADKAEYLGFVTVGGGNILLFISVNKVTFKGVP